MSSEQRMRPDRIGGLRPHSDEPDLDNMPGLGSVGSYSAMIGTVSPAPPRRAFPPGFAGANPGPSHDDDAPAPKRARRRSAKP